MTIYIDPSEAHTRLPDSVVRAAVQLPGLEAYTGADILVSIINEPKIINLNDPPRIEIMKLEKHLAVGMLVQRKTTDLLASIPYLKECLAKMENAKPKYGAWLLFVGDLTIDRETGCAKVSGQTSRWQWTTARNAIRRWQWRGGCVDFLKYDNMIAGWLNDCLDEIVNLEAHPEITIELRQPVQRIIGSQIDELRSVGLQSLMAFPDIGLKTAQVILDYCGTLAQCFTFLSDPTNLVLETKPKGLGPVLFANFSRWLGLKPGETMVVDSESARELWAKEETEEQS